MRKTRLLLFVTALTLAIPAAAGDHSVTLTPVNVTRGTVYFSTAMPGGGLTSITTPEPGPECPAGTNETGDFYSSVRNCQLNSLSAGGNLQRHSDIVVYALLQTNRGEQFAVRLSCTREHGLCPQPTNSAAYTAQLSENVDWLAKYDQRPVNAPMKIKFKVGGKNVTYSILNIKLVKNL